MSSPEENAERARFFKQTEQLNNFELEDGICLNTKKLVKICEIDSSRISPKCDLEDPASTREYLEALLQSSNHKQRGLFDFIRQFQQALSRVIIKILEADKSKKSS